MIQKDNWGWRARFGMFIVSCEAVPEAEWWAMAPDGISVHASRVDSPAPWAVWEDTDRSQLTLATDLVRGASHFAAMHLNAIVIGHSSSSLLGGADWDETVVRTLSKRLPDDARVTTNGLDCQAALRAMGVKHPYVVFPPWFSDALLDAGSQYFASRGFSPSGALRVDPGRQWRDLSPGQLYPQGMGFEQDVKSVYRQIRDGIPIEADGILIAGTGFRCVGIIDALEKDLGRPVITANQASLWHCMQMTGMNAAVSGYGALLAGLDN